MDKLNVWRGAYFKIGLVAIVGTILISVVSLLFLNRLSDIAMSAHRDSLFLNMAESIRLQLATLSPEDLAKNDRLISVEWRPFRGPGGPGGPPPPHFGLSMPPPPPRPESMREGPPGPPRPPRGVEFWVVNAKGIVEARSTKKPFPVEWSSLPRPQVVREVVSKEDFFRLSPGVFVLQLANEPARFLVISDTSKPPFRTLFGTQAILTFLTTAMAFLFASAFTFFYLRSKSGEASRVLLRLEEGDLKARFEVKKFDEFSGLMNDFNRMAQSIERLVTRVQVTESARKDLLQELGHDLRTPLTSLSVQLETLRFHYGKLSEAERTETFEAVQAEIRYLKELMENLLTIASLDEPHFKATTVSVDLIPLLEQELKSRANRSSSLHWGLDKADSLGALSVLGDAHLVLRLFKNGLDNAERYAKSEVRVEIEALGDRVQVKIIDDGPGLRDEDLASFGKRRSKRTVRPGASMNFSLGLGSVIMKSIAELHGGEIEIANRSNNKEERQGACLTIRLPMGLISAPISEKATS